MNAAHDFSRAQENVLVLGLGKTGLSVIEYLAPQGVNLTVADSRQLAPYQARVANQYPGVEIISGGLPTERFHEFDRIVVSPGVEVDSDQPMVGDIELFARAAAAPVIGITGSNGKSTVTMLVSVMLEAAACDVLTGGNIGTPALDLLKREAPDFYVLELSSFQLETTCSLRARAATVLNVSEDHMDRYRSFDDYLQAKARVLDGAQQVVLNRDDPESGPLVSSYPDAVTFGPGAAPRPSDFGVAEHEGERWICQGRRPLVRVDGLTLQGEQNVANVMAALALVSAAGVVLDDAVIAAAAAYGGLEHRCELVAEIDGVRWINDSKGTNVGATVAAIRGFGDKTVLVAGGVGKGADFLPLRDAVAGHVRHVVLFGQDAAAIESALGGVVAVEMAMDLAEAVEKAAAAAEKGSVVLFSPACASFDMFENFEQRGLAFRQLVEDRGRNRG